MDSHENSKPSNRPACNNTSSAGKQRWGLSLSVSAPAFTPVSSPSRSASTGSSSSNSTASNKIPSLYSPFTGNSIWEQPGGRQGSASYRPPSRVSSSSTFTSKTEPNEDDDEVDADADVEAILRLTSNMHSFVDLHRKQASEKQQAAVASTISTSRPPSPQSTAVFSADLDRVHGWFREELQDDTQRLMTVFSLIQLMPLWQQDFLVQLIVQGKDQQSDSAKPPPRAAVSPLIVAESSEGQPPRSTPSIGSLSWRNRPTQIAAADHKGPPKLAAPTPRRASSLIHEDAHGQQHFQWTAKATAPSPMRASSSFAPVVAAAVHSTAADRWSTRSSSSSSGSSSSNEQHPLSPIDDITHIPYFWSDFRTWLRLLRLHKYEPALSRVDRHRLLSWTGADLERVGVGAMGARNKFLRLFEQIRKAEDELR